METLYLCEQCEKLTVKPLVKVNVMKDEVDDQVVWSICHRCLDYAVEGEVK